MSGFGSFLDVAKGKAVSPAGTFGTSRRRMDLRQPTCGTDTIYYPKDGIETVMRGSKGVWRTEKRFTPLTDDASPGPIYKIPEDLTKQKGLSWGKPPPLQRKKESEGGNARRSGGSSNNVLSSSSGASGGMAADVRSHSPLPSLGRSLYLSTAGGSGNSSSAASGKRPASRCTFGTPHPSALPDKPPSDPSRGGRRADQALHTSGEISAASNHIPPYRGRWGSPPKKPAIDEEEERRRKAKDKELLDVLRQGYVQQQTYRSSTPSFTMGTRAALIPPRSITPGPNAYDVGKFKKDSKPTCPTFVGKGHDILEFNKGQDSPGPALYGKLRYI